MAKPSPGRHGSTVQPDDQSNVDLDHVYLVLTRDELAGVIAGLRAIGSLTFAERLEQILQPRES